jgi:hypothetical protein
MNGRVALAVPVQKCVTALPGPARIECSLRYATPLATDRAYLAGEE